MVDQMIDSEQPILEPPWKELAKVASGWEYGSKHSHEEIAAIMRIAYGTLEYYQQVNRAIEELISEGKRIVNMRSTGYRVLMPNEHIVFAVYDAKKGTLKIKEGISNLDDAPVNIMTDNERRKCEGARSALASTYVKSVDGVTQAAQIAGIKRNQRMLSSGNSQKSKGV